MKRRAIIQLLLQTEERLLIRAWPEHAPDRILTVDVVQGSNGKANVSIRCRLRYWPSLAPIWNDLHKWANSRGLLGIPADDQRLGWRTVWKQERQE